MPKATANSFEIGGSLELSRRGRRYLGGQRIRLLEAIDRLGSISQAARDIGLSYKAAWDAVDAMNNLADHPLLVRTSGGQRGGGSRLTEHGHQIVRLYRLLESGYQRLLARMQTHVRDVDAINFDTLTEFLRTITVKTSARNQYRGTIKSVRKGAVNADVILDLGDDLEIFANITNASVEELQLRPGREATALIKASLVLLSPDQGLRVSARNRLRGTVAEIIPGSVNSEVILQLAGERRLAAIVTVEGLKELQLTVGAPCCAIIKASHVLIAVSD